jgi:hypothetical protein
MAYNKELKIDLEVVDTYHLLLEHDWFYVPEFIDVDFKTGHSKLDGLVWREFSIHPPKEILN